jgi:hypothetical protein
MSPDELVMWARGYVEGWERADECARYDPPAEPEPEPSSVGSIERGMWRKAWRELVLAGVDPTEELIRERMWKLQTL